MFSYFDKILTYVKNRPTDRYKGPYHRGDRGTVEHGAQWNFSVCRLMINVVFDKFWILDVASYGHFVIGVDGVMLSLLLLS